MTDEATPDSFDQAIKELASDAIAGALDGLAEVFANELAGDVYTGRQIAAALLVVANRVRQDRDGVILGVAFVVDVTDEHGHEPFHPQAARHPWGAWQPHDTLPGVEVRNCACGAQQRRPASGD